MSPELETHLTNLMSQAQTLEDWQEIADYLDANDRGEKFEVTKKRLFINKTTNLINTIYSSYKEYFSLGKSIGTCSVKLFSQIIPEGYGYETHQVVTEDGYILNLFRLKSKGNKQVNFNKPVIYLQHGLGASADSWVIHHEKEALGLMLVNSGFDVWLGNARGTKYSYYHKTFNPDQKEYWDFSWQDMAQHDIPTSLKYIQKTAQTKKLMYVGHSQGTTEAFVLLSDEKTHKWANDLITHYVALAPICFMTHFKQKMILTLSRHQEWVYKTAMKVKMWQFQSNNCEVKKWKKIRWNLQCVINKKSCYKKYTFMDAYPEMDDISRTGIYLNTKPQGMSLKTLLHYAQQITQPVDNPQFTKFDYGPEGNLKKYGTKKAPIWNVGNITTKLTFLVGTGDLFSTPLDVKHLKSQVVNAKSVNMKVIPKYGHTTMVLGVDNYTYMTEIVDQLKSEVGL